MSPSITSAQIASLRLQALGLVSADATPREPSPVEVVRRHLAMQSQDWGGSRWAIGSRSDVLTDADVLAAYDSGAIVRSWPMRGTVHAVAAEDLHWMLELMGHRALSGVGRRWLSLGIEESMLERAREVAVTLLSGGRSSTRSEMLGAFAEAGLDFTGQRGYHVVWYLAQTGTLVFGPTRDGEQLLVLLDEWIPRPRSLTREAALLELARRYLFAHGPATLEDLVHWTKLTIRDCRAAIDAVREAGELMEVQRAGQPLYMLIERWESLDAGLAPRACGVQALAPFDEHLLGYRHRHDVIAAAHAAQIAPGANGVFRPTIVAEAHVMGTWTKVRRTRCLVLRIVPFAPLTKAEMRGARAALHRYGAFVGTGVFIED